MTFYRTPPEIDKMLSDAMLERDRLRSENAELRAALEMMVSHSELSCDSHNGDAPISCHRCRDRNMARAILERAKQ